MVNCEKVGKLGKNENVEQKKKEKRNVLFSENQYNQCLLKCKKKNMKKGHALDNFLLVTFVRSFVFEMAWIEFFSLITRAETWDWEWCTYTYEIVTHISSSTIFRFLFLFSHSAPFKHLLFYLVYYSHFMLLAFASTQDRIMFPRMAGWVMNGNEALRSHCLFSAKIDGWIGGSINPKASHHKPTSIFSQDGCRNA